MNTTARFNFFAPYTFSEQFDYHKYLERQSHFDTLATDINQSVDQSIAKLAFSNAEIAKLSRDAIVESNENVARDIVDALTPIRDGITNLREDVNEVRSSVDRATAAIDDVRFAVESGFHLTVERLTSIESLIEEMLEAIKSPDKNWALEKYEFAKQSYRREFYDEALDYLDEALNGRGEQGGYRMDPRIYLLKGTILLGDCDNFEPRLINLEGAKACFESAVKYSKPTRDSLIGADKASREQLFEPWVYAKCCSAWASYVQGKISEAESVYREAVGEGPNSARANFFLAKILAHQMKIGEAEEFMGAAIRLNFYYAAMLASDSDCKNGRDRFEALLDIYRRELLDKCLPYARAIFLYEKKETRNILSKLDIERLPLRSAALSKAVVDGDAAIGAMLSKYLTLIEDSHRVGDEFSEAERVSRLNVESEASRLKATVKPERRGPVRHEHEKVISWIFNFLLLASLVTFVFGFLNEGELKETFYRIASWSFVLFVVFISVVQADEWLRNMRFDRELREEYNAKLSGAQRRVGSARKLHDVTMGLRSDYETIISSETGRRDNAVPEAGHIYSGKVVKIVDFGAFVNFFGKHDGLVHVSQIANKRLNHPSDALQEGQEVKVKLLGFDDRGKVRLSMKNIDQATGEETAGETSDA